MYCTRCGNLLWRYKKIGKAEILGYCKHEKKFIMIPRENKEKPRPCGGFIIGKPKKWKPKKRKESVKNI
jgi:hypothetical protein